MKFTVGGVDYSSIVLIESLRIEFAITRRGTTASFVIMDAAPAPGVGWTPITIAPLSEVLIYDQDGTTLIFAGVAGRPSVRTPADNVNEWHVDAIDGSFYFEAPSNLVNKAYRNQTASAIVIDLIASALPTFTTTHVQTGPVIPYVTFSHKTVGEALRKLVKLASQSIPYSFWVDPTYDVHFANVAQLSASALSISDVAADIAAGATAIEQESFEYVNDGTQVANNVVVRGGFTLSNSFTDTFAADGSQTAFPLSYGPSQQSGAPLPTVTVGGVAKTVAYDTGVAATTDFLVSFTGVGPATQTNVGTATLRNGTLATVGAGVVVVCTYQFDIPVIVAMSSPSSIARYNTASAKTAGRFSIDIYDQTLHNYDSARARAQSHLAANAFAVPTVRCRIPESYSGNLPGVGTTISVRRNQVGLAATTMAIIQMTVSGTDNGNRVIDLTLEGTGA